MQNDDQYIACNTTTQDAFGNSTVTVQVTDTAGATNDTSFMLIVDPVNDAPTFTGNIFNITVQFAIFRINGR